MTTWRYLVQRALTREWLHSDLPLHRDAGSPSWDLSGPGALSGTVAPDLGQMVAADGRPVLEEWGSLIYAEQSGLIRWGGIIVSSKFEGQSWKIEAAGFSTYPHGIPYGGSYSQIGVDPADVVAHLWSHVQSQPDAALGVTVTGDKTTVRLGTPAKGDEEADPYELQWWETPDVGREIQALAQATPFDFVEMHTWDGNDVAHEVQIGYPRLGRRRHDLSFILRDNVIDMADPERDGDEFANEVIGLGAGEGKIALRRPAAQRDGRLRRPYVLLAKDVGAAGRLDAMVRDELIRRQPMTTIPEITVNDHPNARIGSWQLGDDILVQATVPHLGELSIWHRIVSWALVTDTTARLTLARSDSFTYGG